MSKVGKNSSAKVSFGIPEKYRRRFEDERLETNITRMRGFAIYIVGLQVVLQLTNVMFPQGEGDGMRIPLIYYIVLSLVTLFVGIVYWMFLSLAKAHRIKNRKIRVFLVHSLLYIYFFIQMTFCSFNILSHQGINGQLILVLLFGLIPILQPFQVTITILGSCLYTAILMLSTQHIIDADGFSAWIKFFQTDMRAYFVIVNGLTILISVFIYRLYVSNFLKSVELEETNTHLEETVRKRTKELEEKTQAAQAASAAKSRFLTSMSHEIRTPLNAIIGMTRIAKNAETKAKTAASLDQISASSDHLLGILNDILDMSNIESGRLAIENNRFALNSALENIENIIRERCVAKGLNFSCNSETLPQLTVLGDKLRLKQILINLLGNAVKFTREDGSVDFTVTVESETKTGVEVSFTVRDTGIGISSGQMETLFTPFEQGSINSMKHGGTGLGLAIAQSLVQMMGGKINVESVPEKGSVFSFRLNFETVSVLQESGDPVVPDLSGKRILSVEDIEINRIVLKELLGETKASIDEAVDGALAVEKFRASPGGYYNLIFMDLLMPNMNGYDATRNIRSLPRADAVTVPIIALSANAYQEDVSQAIAAGMDGHIAKPVDFTELMRVLAEKVK
ncbi:MAG: response regulator [Spirochaetaceae bacterium]|jgi:signal transduction histidine kinase/CheY-like chemotaxis protein|nr:response regulator [Spirochaetaceae bacterium]